VSAKPAAASIADGNAGIIVRAEAAAPPGPPIDAAASLFPSLRPFWGRLLRRRGYDIRPARTPHQRGAVNMLLRRMYAWRGCVSESVRPLPYDANRLMLAAWDFDDVVATLTLGRDSPNGLWVDRLYAAELANLRRPGRVLCEASGLAVDPDFSSPDLLATLFKSALHYAKDSFGASDAVIEVNPRHARYYENRMGFRQIGRRRHCDGANSPMLLLHQSLGEMAIPRASASRSAGLFGGR
jgi:hypothetical protein